MFSGLVALTVRNKRKNKQLIDCKQKYRMLVLELFPYELATTFLHHISNHKVNSSIIVQYISPTSSQQSILSGFFGKTRKSFFSEFCRKVPSSCDCNLIIRSRWPFATFDTVVVWYFVFLQTTFDGSSITVGIAVISVSYDEERDDIDNETSNIADKFSKLFEKIDKVSFKFWGLRNRCIRLSLSLFLSFFLSSLSLSLLNAIRDSVNHKGDCKAHKL